jgi:exodeoxyribonuclease VII small subunit
MNGMSEQDENTGRIAQDEPSEQAELFAGEGESDAGIDAMPFEAAYAALERAVVELEDGEQDLDDALALYERGTALAERCNALLAAAELRIRQIDDAGDDAGPVDL